jgi:septal ring factor EnvC (AmiA/AmiB activator)
MSFHRHAMFCVRAMLVLVCSSSIGVRLGQAQQLEQQNLQQVEQALADSAEKQKTLEETVAAAVAEQNALSDKLVSIAETTAQQEMAMAKSDKRMSKLKAEIAKVNLALAQRQDVIAEVLMGLQNLERNPPPALMVAPGDVLSTIRSAMVLGAIVPELRAKADELSQQLASLASLRADLAQQGSEHARALSTLVTARTEMTQVLADKKAMALKSNTELAEEKRTAEALAAKATSLKQLLADLTREQEKLSATEKVEAAARLAAEQKLASLQPGTTMAFAQAQGQINYPAQGQILKRFGDDNGLGAAYDGIVIGTEKLAQVTAPASGKIEFAGKFRSYGQMIILNPGDGYLVVLAGLEQTQATFGQSVKAGEPVGLMGEKASTMAMTNGLTNQTTPVLYVEFRHNGDPVDPTPWWNGTRQEAMR